MEKEFVVHAFLIIHPIIIQYSNDESSRNGFAGAKLCLWYFFFQCAMPSLEGCNGTVTFQPSIRFCWRHDTVCRFSRCTTIMKTIAEGNCTLGRKFYQLCKKKYKWYYRLFKDIRKSFLLIIYRRFDVKSASRLCLSVIKGRSKFFKIFYWRSNIKGVSRLCLYTTAIALWH